MSNIIIRNFKIFWQPSVKCHEIRGNVKRKLATKHIYCLDTKKISKEYNEKIQNKQVCGWRYVEGVITVTVLKIFLN